MSKPKRKLSNFLLTPKFQLKLTYYYIAVGVAVIISTVSGVVFKMLQIREVLNSSLATDFTAQTQITDYTFQIAQISMIGFVAFAMASFIFAMMVSHRIAGPIVAITACIEELIAGNYDYGRKLRPNDELTLIMDGLHDLRTTLKEKEAS